MTKPRDGVGLRAGAHVVALLLVLGLVVAMAIEPTRQLLAQRESVAATGEALRETKRANAMLEARIQRLRDPDYVEQQAREHIGLVRPGEVTYVVMPPSRRSEARERARARADRVAARPPAEPGFVEAVLDFVGL